MDAYGVAEFFEEVAEKLVSVFRPLFKRRYLDRDHHQPVVEVFSKRPLFHHFVQVSIGCSYYARIDFHRLRPANADEPLVLQDIQKLRLKRQR